MSGFLWVSLQRGIHDTILSGLWPQNTCYSSRHRSQERLTGLLHQTLQDWPDWQEPYCHIASLGQLSMPGNTYQGLRSCSKQKPLFTLCNGHPLSLTNFLSMLHKLPSSTGLSPQVYNTQSPSRSHHIRSTGRPLSTHNQAPWPMEKWYLQTRHVYKTISHLDIYSACTHTHTQVTGFFSFLLYGKHLVGFPKQNELFLYWKLGQWQNQALKS